MSDEWVCPRCGLEGDHLKTVHENRCKECCAVDAAAEMRDCLAAFVKHYAGAKRGQLGNGFAYKWYGLAVDILEDACGRKVSGKGDKRG